MRAPASGYSGEPRSGVQVSLDGSELGNLESVACGSPPRRAYPPQWSCGREAEGGGLLNRYRVVKPYRGFESLPLRHPPFCPVTMTTSCRTACRRSVSSHVLPEVAQER